MTDLDDFSSKERFLELEREKEAFDKLFNGQWKKAKKAIRKNILWAPTPKIEKKKKAKENENTIEDSDKLDDANSEVVEDPMIQEVEDKKLILKDDSQVLELEELESTNQIEEDKDLNSIQSENDDVE